MNVPSAQRRPPAPPLGHFRSGYPNRNEAISTAHATGQYSYQQIAKAFGLHFTTVGRIVRMAKGN